MAVTPLISIYGSAQLTELEAAPFVKEWMKEINMFDYKMLEDYGSKVPLPNHMYGDTTATGNTGGDAARAAGLYTSRLDGFTITAWDDLAFIMNYGFRLDDLDNSNAYTAGLDYNFTEFQIDEGKGYGGTGVGSPGGTNYRAHDKAITTKFNVNVPCIRFGATGQYDSLFHNLVPTREAKQMIKEYAKQAKMVQGQYIRATIINEATQHTATNLIGAGTAEYTAFEATLVAAKRDIKLRQGEPFTGAINATDKVGTRPVNGGYICIIHSLLEETIKHLPDFDYVIDYSSQMGLLPGEFGALRTGGVRFVVNDLLVRNSAASSLTIADSMSAGGTDIGTYNMILMGKDAYTIAQLSGESRYTMFIDGAGKGDDVLRLHKNIGWKAMLGCKVHRPAWIHNFPVNINAVS